jgi:hypothetical protein
MLNTCTKIKVVVCKIVFSVDGWFTRALCIVVQNDRARGWTALLVKVIRGDSTAPDQRLTGSLLESVSVRVTQQRRPTWPAPRPKPLPFHEPDTEVNT